jgi:aminoglycoside 6'-N-acetyltransferase
MRLHAFRPVTRADLPLLREWRTRPHVRRWWGEPHGEEPEEALADHRIAMWIVEHDGRPFAYAQDYSPHQWEVHHFAHLPDGARGLDQYIGEPDMVGLGHGSAFVRQHCARLFAAGAPAIGTDPHPDNARAIRAYRKAGFEIASGPVETAWGRALLMECYAPALSRSSPAEPTPRRAPEGSATGRTW